MMAKKAGSTVSFAISLALAVSLIAPAALAQSSKSAKPATSTKRSEKTPAQKTQASRVNAKSAESSCDGALEIVPSQPVTFARKRRPKPVTSQSSS